MAKYPAKCPRCGSRVEFGDADARITCPRCQATLTAPRTATARAGGDPLVGQTLGEFEILELLGRGGMGAVYKGRQAALDRLVAIKVLPQHLASDASYVARFEREAKAAAAIEHPHIVQVYTVGEAGGVRYIAMQFVDGENLHDLLRRRGPLPPDRALELLKQVTSALAEAHSCGILHRDIKPSNILLDAKGNAKVADFGLAKHEGVDVSVTASGAALGTPLYMPPEAAVGTPFDARSDLYSLGATFYHLLAGRPPFEGATPAQLIVKHFDAEPPPLAGCAPGTPPALCETIHRLLAKAPAERYQTADDLLEAVRPLEAQLKACESERTATMPTRGCPWRDWGWHDRRTMALTSLAAAALLVVILVFVHFLGKEPAGPNPAPGSRAGARTAQSPTVARPAADDQGPWGQWEDLFDGKTLDGWHVHSKQTWEEPWAAHGAARVDEGAVVLAKGKCYTAIALEQPMPKMDYELAFDYSMRPGNECSMIFPVGQMSGMWQVHQTRTQLCGFGEARPGREIPRLALGTWHRRHLRVEAHRIRVWIDGREAVSVDTRQLPLVGTVVRTPGADLILYAARDGETRLRNIRLRRLRPGKAGAPLPPPDDQQCWGEWEDLFDGKTLDRWRVVRRFPPGPKWAGGRGGVVHVEEGQLLLERGGALTGVSWTGGCPEFDYEVELSARWLEGDRHFLTIVFPVFQYTCGLACDQAGSVVRLEGVDDRSAEAGETIRQLASPFEKDRWYRLRLRATYNMLDVWVDGEEVMDFRTGGGRRFQPYAVHAPVRPLGVLAYKSRLALREIRLRRVKVVAADATLPPLEGDGWESLFDGRTLEGWKPVEEFRVGGKPQRGGKVHVQSGQIILEYTGLHTAIALAHEFPSDEYELAVDAMRVAGESDFCTIILPVGAQDCCLTIGGWVNTVVGIGFVDGLPAVGNETGRRIGFENGQWYRVRVRVTQPRIEAWVGGEKLIDLPRAGRRIAVWRDRQPCDPVQIFAHRSRAALRNIRLRRLKPTGQ